VAETFSPEPPDTLEPPAVQPSRNILQIAWERKALVLLGLVVGAGLGVLVYTQRTPVYRSSAQVLVVKKQANAVPITGGDPRWPYVDDYVSAHLILIRSPLIVNRAVEKHQLGALKSFAGGDPAGAIAASLTVTRENKESYLSSANVINLAYQGPVADDSRVVLDAVIDSYKDFLDETYRNVSDNTVDLITKARDLLQTNLKEEEDKYRAFREKSPFLGKGKDGTTLSQTRLAEIETRQSALLVRKAELQERLQAIEKARGEGAGRAVLLSLVAAAEKGRPETAGPDRSGEDQLLPLLLQEKTLLQDCGEDHPEVKAVRQKIAMIREFYAKKAAGTRGAADAAGTDSFDVALQSLKQELLTAELSLRSLDRLREAEQKEARELARYEIQDEAYRSDIARTQQLYEQTIKRLQEINLVRDFGGYEARVINPPGGGGKISPLLWQFLVSGVVLGLLAGGGLAYLADRTDTSFRTPEEIRRRLGLPVVGHIPLFDEAPATPPEAAGGENVPAIDPSVFAFHHAHSVEAEAFRRLRTSLYFSTEGEQHKVIQVTSPNMSDGKTTLAANLAVCMAQSGKKVILVDADFRRPRQHRVFGLSSETGLSSVLRGEADPADAALASPVPGLSVLPCGPRPPNPADLLTSPRFDELLSCLREHYDFVLLDTPPLLAVSDPCVVAPRADGVLLAIRASKNGRPAAERAKEILVTLEAKVLGVVVNGVGAQGNSYDYTHYAYDDYYGYNSGNGEAVPRPGEDAPGGAGPLPGHRPADGPDGAGGRKNGRGRSRRRGRGGNTQSPGAWRTMRRWLGVG
jgi:capsular exopolysaccharide synthesis family protein